MRTTDAALDGVPAGKMRFSWLACLGRLEAADEDERAGRGSGAADRSERREERNGRNSKKFEVCATAGCIALTREWHNAHVGRQEAQPAGLFMCRFTGINNKNKKKSRPRSPGRTSPPE